MAPRTPAPATSPQAHASLASAVPPTVPSADDGSDFSTAQLVELGQRYLLGNYRQAPIVLVRGQGSTVVDKDGNEYLDFAAGVAVCALGHAHPRLSRTIAEQAAKLMHVSNYFYNEENVLLAQELCERTGYARAFFCNSGAEANEAMLKLARRYFYARGDKDKIRFVAFDNAFHGRTLATVNLTGTPAYKEGFGPKLEGITHVPYGDLDALRRVMGPDVCGIFVEPVQGEGGVLPPPPGFLQDLRALADEHGALVLLDEIQTGMGRTGELLASEHTGVRGDVATLAKGLGGGFPIGCTLVSERLAGALPPGTHGSTFGGNPLASAAARTVLASLFEDRLIERARTLGELLGRRLAAVAERHPDLCEGERGLGLLRALVLKESVDARRVLATVRDKGVLLTIAGGRGLRFTPPLVVTEAEIDEAVRRVEVALGAVRVDLVAGT
jgi:acetylornithine/N-succinyldiaminopimelate aminotransferase